MTAPELRAGLSSSRRASRTGGSASTSRGAHRPRRVLRIGNQRSARRRRRARLRRGRRQLGGIRGDASGPPRAQSRSSSVAAIVDTMSDYLIRELDNADQRRRPAQLRDRRCGGDFRLEGLSCAIVTTGTTEDTGRRGVHPDRRGPAHDLATAETLRDDHGVHPHGRATAGAPSDGLGLATTHARRLRRGRRPPQPGETRCGGGRRRIHGHPSGPRVPQPAPAGLDNRPERGYC